MTKAVLVIGAGPSGMAQVNALVGAAGLDVRCFEMNSEIGGLWTWTDDVGDCHGSMYRYHQTNGLNEFLELEEYSFLEHFRHLITVSRQTVMLCVEIKILRRVASSTRRLLDGVEVPVLASEPGHGDHRQPTVRCRCA